MTEGKTAFSAAATDKRDSLPFLKEFEILGFSKTPPTFTGEPKSLVHFKGIILYPFLFRSFYYHGGNSTFSPIY
jgi:hypothetical protein